MNKKDLIYMTIAEITNIVMRLGDKLEELEEILKPTADELDED